jgi:hypothetical protein
MVTHARAPATITHNKREIVALAAAPVVVHSGAVPAVVHHAAAYNQECHTAAG